MIQALKKNRTKTQLERIKRADPLTKWILKKIFVDRENCMIKVLGKIQRGKSTVATELKWRLLPIIENFVDTIIFHPEGLSGFYIKGVKRGDVVVWEEIGTESGGISRRRWYEFNNILVIDVMQTHGFEGTVCIVDLPSSKYIDSNTEPLIDVQIEVKKIDRRNKTNIFVAYRLEWDENQQKVYKHCFTDDNGEKIETFAWRRTFPKEVIKQYKEKEEEFKRWVQQRVDQEIRRKKITPDEEEQMFLKIMENVKNVLVVRNNKFNVSRPLIENEFKIGHRLGSRLKMRVEKEILTNPKYSPLKASLSSNLIFNLPEISTDGEGKT